VRYTQLKTLITPKNLRFALSNGIRLSFQELMLKSNPLHLRIDQHNPDKANAIINAILAAISARDYLTIKEACQLLDTLVHLQDSIVGISLPKLNKGLAK
jgi:hypothetical protein